MNGTFLAKMAAGAARYRVSGHRLPLHVQYAVTRRCNTLCSHCAIPLGARAELGTDEAVALLDHLARIGTVRVTITGGEPLVRPDIGVLIDRCADHGLWTTLETNGARVPEQLERLRRLRQLVLPLDGAQAAHDQLRGPGSYDEVIAALEATRKPGRAPLDVWTTTLLHRDNLDQVGHVLDLADRYQFTAMFQVLQSEGTPFGKAAAAWVARPEAVRKALRVLLEAKLAGRRVGMTEKTLRYLLSWEDTQRAWTVSPQEDLHCLAGQLYCTIDADGRVYPCTLHLGRGESAKSVRSDGFEAAFDTLKSHACRACNNTALTEYNYLYNLNFATLYEWARSGRWRQQAGEPPPSEEDAA